jgi:hypothetical protein
MIYVQEFNIRSDVSNQQLQVSYARLVEGWQKVWPSNRFIGLYNRKFALGPEREYMAIWELPNFEAFDEWRSDWPGFVENRMKEVEDEFFGLICDLQAGVMVPMELE